MSDSPETYEVQPSRRDGAVVRPPASKSITNRALVAAALSIGESTIVGPLDSDDSAAMRSALEQLGISFAAADGGRSLVVRATGYLSGGGRLDARASGTTARFITAVATLADGSSVVDGTSRMRERPIGHLVSALSELGAKLSSDDGFPPVQVSGGGLPGGSARIDASDSSQFASAVMLASPRAASPVILELAPPIVSMPYLTTTMEVMRAFGARVEWLDDSSIRIEATGYHPTEYSVEADASAAVYPWAAAAVTGSTVTVVGLDPESTQADMGALEVMSAMGCSVARSSQGISVTGSEHLRGVEVDMNHCPDAVLAIAVVAAFADTATTITNIANLRIKETDRLAALEAELPKLGAEAETGPDWLRVTPISTRRARIATYNDHRMAMAFAIGGLRQPGVVIEDPDCVNKTWPGFFDMLESLS